MKLLKRRFEDKDVAKNDSRNQFIRLCKVINTKFHPAGFRWDNIEKHLHNIIDYHTMRQEFVSLLCRENEIHFEDGILEVLDRQALWVVANEILYNEDYYFRTDKTYPRIFDLGSNFGLSIYYFKRLYPDSVIDAFEPDPDLFAILQRNIERNKWTGITLHNCALNVVEGLFTFNKNVQKTLAGSLTSRRIGKEKTYPIQVQCKRLSSYLTEPVDFLKIDVEGVEEGVLSDIRGQLGGIDRIFCEYHHGDGLATDRLFRIIKLLEEYNFAYRVGPSPPNKLGPRPMLQVGRPYSTSVWACRREIL